MHLAAVFFADSMCQVAFSRDLNLERVNNAFFGSINREGFKAPYKLGGQGPLAVSSDSQRDT
jgi:hypothetical protein